MFSLYSVRPSTRPLWISPRQVMLVPVNPSCEDYAKKVSIPVLHLDHILSMIVFICGIQICIMLIYMFMIVKKKFLSHLSGV